MNSVVITSQGNLCRTVLLITVGFLVLFLFHWSYCRPAPTCETLSGGIPIPAKSKVIPAWKKVIFFGDSHTERSFGDGNWAAIISDKLRRKCDVLSRGFSGYNTSLCQTILPKILTKEVAAELVAFTILLGSNDANKYPSRVHVPLNKYKENMLKMVKYAKSVGLRADQIIIMTPPPVSREILRKHFPQLHNSLDIETVGQYATAAREIASIEAVNCVDLFLELQKEADWKSLLSDGLHFSEAGGATVARLLWPYIDKMVKHLPRVDLVSG